MSLRLRGLWVGRGSENAARLFPLARRCRVGLFTTSKDRCDGVWACSSVATAALSFDRRPVIPAQVPIPAHDLTLLLPSLLCDNAGSERADGLPARSFMLNFSTVESA